MVFLAKIKGCCVLSVMFYFMCGRNQKFVFKYNITIGKKGFWKDVKMFKRWSSWGGSMRAVSQDDRAEIGQLRKKLCEYLQNAVYKFLKCV